MEVNVEKSGVMHMRRRGLNSTGETFVNDERIEVVEERAKVGTKALSD